MTVPRWSPLVLRGGQWFSRPPSVPTKPGLGRTAFGDLGVSLLAILAGTAVRA